MKEMKFLFLLLVELLLIKGLLAYPLLYVKDKNNRKIFNATYGKFFSNEYYFIDYGHKSFKLGLGVEENKFLYGITFYKEISFPYMISPLKGFNISLFLRNKESIFLSSSFLFSVNLRYVNFLFSPGFYFFDSSIKPVLSFFLEFRNSPGMGFRIFSYSNIENSAGYSVFIYF